ncbi:hypothetical protein J2N86_10655 [Legionella lytica]|uniref:Uncharacterized protein n=1 Tax=Legionella lytica TaxID=96232 RepID=A0ABY4Y7K8_9GAMM|nr:hypothetical protein [Legionella lytica]USQ13147.1 hypothetical protein J2N86_10655 [Legionella lytica]
MNKVVIIGAGPIGLYLAYKLMQKGIKASIFDPRAGVYLRPGHVNKEDLQKVLKEINETKPITKRVHIKDVERVLYKKIQYLNIPVEKKLFVRLSTTGKGVIVANDENVEEFIECDFVFDCTGSKRSVVHAVNNIISPKPFTIKPIVTEVNVKNNFLAYVKMDEAHKSLIDLFENKANRFNPDIEEPLLYARRIEQVRALGWKELGYPKYYSVNFGEEKVCIYMEAPDNLPKELESAWVETLLRSMSGFDSISFKKLEPSKKPRFVQFQVYPQEVKEVVFEHKNYPTVIPLGDAQMEPHYRLALGLKSGMGRVDLLIDHIEAHQNNIAYFDAQEYFEVIKKNLKNHRTRVTSHFEDRAQYHANWLVQAEKHYEDAIQKAKEQQEPTAHFEKTLIEIKARNNYQQVQQRLAELGNEEKIRQQIDANPEKMKLQLESIYKLLKEAQANLPESFATEHAKLAQNLVHIAKVWKELGNHYFKKQLFTTTKLMFEKGLAIYDEIKLQETHALAELTLYSNLIVCKRKLNENEEIIGLGKKALLIYPKSPELMVISRKILANLLISMEEQVNTGMLHSQEFKVQTQELCELHPELVDQQLKKNLTGMGNITHYMQEFGLFKQDIKVDKPNPQPTSITSNFIM